MANKCRREHKQCRGNAILYYFVQEGLFKHRQMEVKAPTTCLSGTKGVLSHEKNSHKCIEGDGSMLGALDLKPEEFMGQTSQP